MIKNNRLSTELIKFLKNNVPDNYKKLIMYTTFNHNKLKENETTTKDGGIYKNGIYLYRFNNKNLMITRTVDQGEEKINSIIDFDNSGKVNTAFVNFFGSHFQPDSDGSYSLGMIRAYNKKKKKIKWDITDENCEDILENIKQRNIKRQEEDPKEQDIIYIPQNGDPYVMKFVKNTSFDSILKCKLTDHVTPYWLDDYDYKLAIITKDLCDENDNTNETASLIAKTILRGDCFIIDDNISLDKTDINDIILLSALVHKPISESSSEPNILSLMKLFNLN